MTTLNVNQDAVQVGVLFNKIDKENRTVSGWATLNNIDNHNDILSAPASRDAFVRFRGGIREMHQHNAVGTLLSFEEAKKYVQEEDKVYDGIIITARVSEGAENTWKKVLDGTLKGFSLGGKIKEKIRDILEDGREVDLITRYDLLEISLVDNPANPWTKVLSVKKVDDSYVFGDDSFEKSMNIFLDEDSGEVLLSYDEDKEGFKNIGWTDSSYDTTTIREAINKYYEDKEKNVEKVYGPEMNDEILPNNESTDIVKEESSENPGGDVDETHKGGVHMATDETVETTEEVTEDLEKGDDVTEEVVEVEDGENIEKMLKEVFDGVGNLTKGIDAIREESKTSIDEVRASFEKSLGEISEKISDLDELKKTVDGLGEQIEALKSSTAIKKSVDGVGNDDSDDADDEESFWRGEFLGADALVK